MSKQIINDPAYLRDAETTQYELQSPTPQVWDDGTEWRLISWLAFAEKSIQTSASTQSVLATLEAALKALNPATTRVKMPTGSWRLIYGSPYTPILQATLGGIQKSGKLPKGTMVAVGQSLVNLPSAPVTTLFWKRDVIEHKRAERKAARAISRLAGLKYEADPLKQHGISSVVLKDGPSWRWWTEQLNR